MKISLLTAALLAGVILPSRATVSFDMVTVGDPGNVSKAVSTFDATGTAATLNLGAVGYTYRMATEEVTVAQYAEFLNSVDPGGANSLALYNNEMGSNAQSAGIALTSGAAAGSKYSVLAGTGQHPITFVGFDNAARFVNWLSNGQGGGDTESGVYAKMGGGSSSGTGTVFTMLHAPSASFWVPSMDEWFKAAYYDPTLNSGTGGYWDYATRSDTAPANGYATATADTNHANYAIDGSYTMSPGGYPAGNALTDAGTFVTSLSYYGTLDQNGNVDEFIANTSDAETQFYYMGGGWSASNVGLNSDAVYHSKFVDFPSSFSGFRIASGATPVPEPSVSLLLLGLMGGMAAFRRRRV
ncbi:MAG: SUMF1/EgtB/PvdO family nonheme iron enzyme [Verrucomicrobiota bacterium]